MITSVIPVFRSRLHSDILSLLAMIDVRLSTFGMFTAPSQDLFRYSAILMLVVYLTIAILTYSCTKWALNKFKVIKSKVAAPPGPTPLPLIGSAHKLLEGPHKTLELLQIKWPKQYGDIYSLQLGPYRSVNISSPELMEVILKSSKLIDKGPIYKYLHPWLGNSLLVGTGKSWRTTRKMLTPAFHFQILGEYFNVFVKQANVLCQLIEDRVNDDRGILNITQLASNCALDSLIESTMGVELRAQAESSLYVEHLCRMTKILVERFSKPWLALDGLFRLFPLYDVQVRALNCMHAYSEKVIKERWTFRKSMHGNTSSRNGHKPALLDTLLDNYPLTDDSGKVIEENKRAIQQETDTFLFAGHDTTATTMAWFIYCMALHPEEQGKVHRELSDIYDNDERDCTEDDLPRFEYLDCCLKETMRLFTTVPHIERRLTEDVQLGDYHLPSGTNVYLLLYRLHHHERYYTDPFEFKPERFGSESQEPHQHPYVYIPFSAGPRNCIGQRFALMELRVVLATLVRRFEFFWDDSWSKPIPSFQGILKPLNDIKIGVRLRN